MSEDVERCNQALGHVAFALTLHAAPRGEIAYELTIPSSPHHVEIHARDFGSDPRSIHAEAWTEIELETGERGWVSSDVTPYPKARDILPVR